MIGAVVVCSILAVTIFGLLPDQDAASASVSTYQAKQRVYTDHTNMIFGPFKDGPSVTRECLRCHPDAAPELMKTQHWLWVGEEVRIAGHTEPMRIGKKNLLNNFCIGTQSNEEKCMSCHAGYGWADASFDFTSQENVDCLVCHEQTGTYAKGDAGHPKKEVNLVAAAKSVTTPGRVNCGSCHFNGGGGNGVKHGDLDGSLIYPSARIDVHMGEHDFLCVDCHRTSNHRVTGRSMGVSVNDQNGVHCTDCHRTDLHRDERINAHTLTVDCRTCHIPRFALDDPTKTWWDWSTAGQDLDIKDSHVYLKIKGHFRYGKNVAPEYYWYNGTNDRYILGDKIDPQAVTLLNPPYGNIHDESSRIAPFKVHRGKQVYDTQYNYFLNPTTSGEGGFWHEFDWEKSLRLGAEATGVPYSGQHGFAKTGMFWKISHMVAPKSGALKCNDCHGETGRMDWNRLGYEGDPVSRGDRKRLGLIDEAKAMLNTGGADEKL
ncbi:tetrathionate reductase family octaheme c-type cytochrome [bacterium]|nr:tetrathionate reductase family octaheme c-type cytochrome [bacterium]